MKTLKDRREELIEGLIDYTGGCENKMIDDLRENYDGISSILAEFVRSWEGADCDVEGPTKEQDEELDRILDSAADEITEFVEKEKTMKKFELLKETKMERDGKTLYRIRALIDLDTINGEVKAGDLGGYVESEENLSQDGTCWIFDDAIVCDYAEVRNDAIVCDDAVISGHAIVRVDAEVSGNSIVCDYGEVSGGATVSGYAEVSDQATVDGCAIVRGDAKIDGRDIVSGGIIE